MQHHASRNTTDNFTLKQNVIFYALCVLYVLSVAVTALDIAPVVVIVLVSNNENLFTFALISCAEQ